MRRRRAAALALALVIGAASLVWAWPDRRPNVLWITVDGLRPDRLPVYGYAGNTTPVMAYLARQGVVFERAFSDAPWTTAAAASAMTGRFAVHHGLRTPYTRLPPQETTFAGVVQAHGYDTAAIVGSFALDHVYRLDRGFNHYDDRYDSSIDGSGERPHLASAFYDDVDLQRTFLARKHRADSYRTDVAVADAAVAWLKRASRMRPFFLWVHFFGAHGVRKPGDDPQLAAARALGEYDARIEKLDAQIGRLLTELESAELLTGTIVVLQGTAADALGEPVPRGTVLSDAVLHVPLLLAWPGHLSPQRVAAPVRCVDVAPTLLGLIDMALPKGLDGRSLQPLLAGEKTESAALLAETWLGADAHLGMFNPDRSARVPGVWRRAVRTERWKYVRSEPVLFINFDKPPPLPADASAARREELYDLAADPGETTDVATRHPEVVAELRRIVDAVPALPPRPPA